MANYSHTPIGSVDRTILMSIKQRLDTAPYIHSTALNLKHGKPTLTAIFALGYFPAAVKEAYYDSRWYTSGDFEIHYQENWTDDREWKRRWDRHPRKGKRAHYHPPPARAIHRNQPTSQTTTTKCSGTPIRRRSTTSNLTHSSAATKTHSSTN